MFPTNLKEATKTGFIPYILEAEGCTNLCTTRKTKINAIIKDFKSLVAKGYNPNDYISEVLHKYGLSENLLTEAEIRRINNLE